MAPLSASSAAAPAMTPLAASAAPSAAAPAKAPLAALAAPSAAAPAESAAPAPASAPSAAESVAPAPSSAANATAPMAASGLLGFKFIDLSVLLAVLPINLSSTSAELIKRAAGAGLETELDGLRRRSSGNGSWPTLIRRLLPYSVIDGAVVDKHGRRVLPVEAWPVFIDLAALHSFAMRETHRALNSEIVADELMNLGYVAGGRIFGSIRQMDIDKRLKCAALDGEIVAALPALLYRLSADFNELKAIIPSLQMPRELSPRPAPKAIMEFAEGRRGCILVPADFHVLKALASLSPESGCFHYMRSTVMLDGAVAIRYECSRSRDVEAPAGAAVSNDDIDSDKEEEASDGEPGDLDCVAAAEAESGYDDDAGDFEPPLINRNAFASAAKLLRSPHAPRATASTQPYLQGSCKASLLVFRPPGAGGLWLLARSFVRNAAGGTAVQQHAHRLDEYRPPHPALEQAVLRAKLASGTFNVPSSQVKKWVAGVIRNDLLAARTYAGGGFVSWESPILPSLDALNQLSSPGTAARARGGGYAIASQPTMDAALLAHDDDDCGTCLLPLGQGDVVKCSVPTCLRARFHAECVENVSSGWTCTVCIDDGSAPPPSPLCCNPRVEPI